MRCRVPAAASLLTALVWTWQTGCVEPLVIASYPETPEELEQALQYCHEGVARVTWTASLDEVLSCKGCGATRDVTLLVAERAVLAASSGLSVEDPLAVTAALDADGTLLWRDVAAQEVSNSEGGTVQRVTLSLTDDGRIARHRAAEYLCVQSGCRTPEKLPRSRVETVDIRTGDVLEEWNDEERSDRVLYLAGGELVLLTSERGQAREDGFRDVVTLVRGAGRMGEPWSRRFDAEVSEAIASPDGDLLLVQANPLRLVRLNASGAIVFDDEGEGWAPFPGAPTSDGWFGESQAALRLASDETGDTLVTRNQVAWLSPGPRTHIVMRKYTGDGRTQWQRVVTTRGDASNVRATLSNAMTYVAVAQPEGERLRNQVLRVDGAGEGCKRFSIAGPEHLWGPSEYVDTPTPQAIRDLIAAEDGALYFVTATQLGRIELEQDPPQ